MTLIINLTPAEEAQIQAAAEQKGTSPDELVRNLVVDHLPEMLTDSPLSDPTLALFAQWEKEDSQMSPEQIEEERRLWEQFEAGINETRQASGMRLL